MTVSRAEKYNLDQLAQKIEATKQDGFAYGEHAALLFSMLKFPEDVPQVEARHMAKHAISAAAAKGTITAKTLLAEVNKLEAAYLSLPRRRYALATSLSLHQSTELRRIRINGNSIVLERRLPKRYREESTTLLEQGKHSIFGSIPINYLSTRVYVSARTTREAAERGLETIDLVVRQAKFE
jgi:hypothetical protein